MLPEVDRSSRTNAGAYSPGELAQPGLSRPRRALRPPWPPLRRPANAPRHPVHPGARLARRLATRPWERRSTAIGRGPGVSKVVLSRRLRLEALSSRSRRRTCSVNLIDGVGARHRAAVPLRRRVLLRLHARAAGTQARQRGGDACAWQARVPPGATEEERARLADELMADAKNRAEHDHVVRFIRRGVQPHMLRRRRARPVPGHPAAYPRTAPVHARPRAHAGRRRRWPNA